MLYVRYIYILYSFTQTIRLLHWNPRTISTDRLATKTYYMVQWRVTGSKPEINYRFIGNWCHCRTCEIYSSTHSHTIHNAMVANNTQLYKILHYTKFTKRISIEQAIPAFYLFVYLLLLFQMYDTSNYIYIYIKQIIIINRQLANGFTYFCLWWLN